MQPCSYFLPIITSGTLVLLQRQCSKGYRRRLRDTSLRLGWCLPLLKPVMAISVVARKFPRVSLTLRSLLKNLMPRLQLAMWLRVTSIGIVVCFSWALKVTSMPFCNISPKCTGSVVLLWMVRVETWISYAPTRTFFSLAPQIALTTRLWSTLIAVVSYLSIVNGVILAPGLHSGRWAPLTLRATWSKAMFLPMRLPIAMFAVNRV